MRGSRQMEANNVQKGKWHCFDLPFEIVCGGMGVAEKIYYALKDKSEDVKEPLKFSVSKTNTL